MARILAGVTLRQVFALALGIGFFASAPFSPALAQAGAARPTVAVLPLANASGDANQDFFAEGLTDEIAVALTRVPGLDVVARSSIFRFKEPNHDIPAIGKAVNARYLVDGSARKVDTRVRISARLIRADDNAQLWSEDYYTEFANIFDIQEDIAEKIAATLKVPTGLKPGEKLVRDRAKNLGAYEDFLRAKVLARARGAKPLADAAVVLEQVLAREPDFAPAAALLAYDYALTPLFERALRTGMPDEERKVVARTIPRAEVLAKHATMLNPKAAEGFVGLGYANLVQMKMLAAEDAFKQAIALDPNQADGLHGYSQFLAAMGRIKQSIAMREHLQDIEQFIINYTADTAEIYWLDGDTDRAISILQPFAPGRTLELALIQAATGRYREAAVAVRQMPPRNYLPGMTEAAAKLLDSAPARTASPESLTKLGNLGFAYMHVGAPERVMEFYEDEVRGGYFQPISTTWFWHPSYDAVRKTARFKAFARDAGLVEYWRARGWPAACHPVGANDFTCG
jgi:TolB-like protein